MPKENPGDKARRAYLRRFSEGWSTFHAEPDGDHEPKPPPVVTRKSNNPREAYVRRFAHRWWSFHRAEDDEEAAVAGLVIGSAIKFFGFALLAVMMWFVFEASRPIQWTGLTIMTIAAAAWLIRSLYGRTGEDSGNG